MVGCCSHRNWESIGHGMEEEEKVKKDAQNSNFSYWVDDPWSRPPFG